MQSLLYIIGINQPMERKMIIQTVNENQFIDSFRTWDTYKNNFSYDGLKALYEYFEEFAECQDSGTFELDVVAICCDFTEYKNFEEFQSDYPQYKSLFGGHSESVDYYTSVILPECWNGKDCENHEEVKDLPFIIQNF